MPKISVIIPNFNHAVFLSKRIESVLGQSIRDIEVIILDDASTDESVSVIRRYATDPRVRIIPSSVNSGNPFVQWNRGVSEARGEYVWVAESDDYADPLLLETLLTRMESNPGVGVAYCDSLRVLADGQVGVAYKEYYRQEDQNHWMNDFVASGREEILKFMIYRNTIPNASAVLFRKAIYDQVGGAPVEYRLCGDWMFWIKMLQVCDLIYVAAPLNYFRWHGGGVRGTSGDFVYFREQCRVLKYVVDNCSPGDLRRRRALNRMAAAWAASVLDKPSVAKWKGALEVCRVARVVDRHPGMRFCKRLALHYPSRLREALRHG